MTKKLIVDLHDELMKQLRHEALDHSKGGTLKEYVIYIFKNRKSS